jgi:GTP-binding protein
LTPHLGVVRLGDGASFVLADLPGLIEGAAEGRGLGHQFLKHLERARAIVHLVDLSGFERPDPVADYQAIRDELLRYDADLAALPELVALNKIDLPDGVELAEIVAEELRKLGVERIQPISAVSGAGCDELLRQMAELLRSDEARSLVSRRAESVADDSEAPEPEGPGYLVDKLEEGYYRVAGAEVERLVAMCDLENDEAVMRFHRQLVRIGVLDALRQAGCQDGDAVVIGEVILDFQE